MTIICRVLFTKGEVFLGQEYRYSCFVHFTIEGKNEMDVNKY